MRRKKLHRRFKKAKKEVKDLVPVAKEKAAALNPLAEPEVQPGFSEDVPQITNETIGVHREEVLSGARKFIYPLRHSKRRIVAITSAIITAAFIGLLIYCFLGLYKLYQYNTFLYRATQVIPFPIAKAENKYIGYEDYLFELRHYVHYYQNQLQSDFSGDDHQQLLRYRKQALDNVINNAYVKTLARQNGIKVSNGEAEERITEVRNQNRLGDNKVFADVLRSYWGWSVSDFKRLLKQEILSEKVAAKLDTATTKRANDVLAKLKAGANFADLAKKVSDDPSVRSESPDYGFAINKSNPNVSPQVVDALFKLKPGHISGVINAGPTLEIVKVLSNNGRTVTAQHISFKLKDISDFIDGLKAKNPPRIYVHF
jgi:hypothetical protein